MELFLQLVKFYKNVTQFNKKISIKVTYLIVIVKCLSLLIFQYNLPTSTKHVVVLMFHSSCNLKNSILVKRTKPNNKNQLVFLIAYNCQVINLNTKKIIV